MSKMGWPLKVAIVIVGYVAACIAAVGAVYVNGLFIPQSVQQASSGMYAFGDMILWLCSFGFCTSFPTIAAIYFVVREIMLRRQVNTV